MNYIFFKKIIGIFVFILLYCNISVAKQKCIESKESWNNCQATITYSNGNKYVGEFKEGLYHGQGTYTYSNGNKYVGEFKEGDFNGQGTFEFDNGNKNLA